MHGSEVRLSHCAATSGTGRGPGDPGPRCCRTMWAAAAVSQSCNVCYHRHLHDVLPESMSRWALWRCAGASIRWPCATSAAGNASWRDRWIVAGGRRQCRCWILDTRPGADVVIFSCAPLRCRAAARGRAL